MISDPLLSVPLPLLAAVSGDGRVWRAFDHLIAAGAGRLLCVPLHLARGELTGVVDGCPVPWEEALVVIDAPFAAHPLAPACPADPPLLQALRLAVPWGWGQDWIRFGRGTSPVRRIGHESGLRYAVVEDGI